MFSGLHFSDFIYEVPDTQYFFESLSLYSYDDSTTLW